MFFSLVCVSNIKCIEMKRLLMLLGAFIMITATLFSQDGNPITVQKKGISSRYYQNDQQLKGKDLKSVLTSYSGSESEYKIASRSSLIGVLLIGGGCLVIGASSLYDSLRDLNTLNSGSLDVGNTSVAPYLIGCGMVVAGIPLLLIGNSHLIKSINLYNDQFRSGMRVDANIQFCILPAGLGVKINF